MAGLDAIAAVGADPAPLAIRIVGGNPAATPASGADFGDVLMAGIRNLDRKVGTADGLVRQFAVDDSVPVHQVTIALAEARLSVELAMQVRDRLVESYRELMNMPL